MKIAFFVIVVMKKKRINNVFYYGIKIIKNHFMSLLVLLVLNPKQINFVIVLAVQDINKILFKIT